MPGTHSKWVDLNAGTVRAFATFMTGEMFELLARQSILAHGIEGTEVRPDDPDFAAALADMLARPAEFANAAFATRPAGLLGYTAKGAGAARLSGVLIGAEIAGARSRFGALEEVCLVASGGLSALYAKGLEIAGARIRSLDAETAVRQGLYAAASGIRARRADA
jgi:2-dehydro-3-deoxygalactonokinase